MTSMAVMLIYGKKDLKFLISGTERPMTLKFGMQHRRIWLYLVYSNDDFWLSKLAYFTAVSLTFV